MDRRLSLFLGFAAACSAASRGAETPSAARWVQVIADGSTTIAVDVSPSGEVLLVQKGDHDVTAVRLDRIGEERWRVRLPADACPGVTSAAAHAADESASIVVLRGEGYPGTWCAMAVDSDGIRWSVPLNSFTGGRAQVAMDRAGHAVIASGSPPHVPGVVVALDGDREVWRYQAAFAILAVQAAPDGGVALVTASHRPHRGDVFVSAVALDRHGVERWRTNLFPTALHTWVPVSIDDNGRLTVGRWKNAAHLELMSVDAKGRIVETRSIAADPDLVGLVFAHDGDRLLGVRGTPNRSVYALISPSGSLENAVFRITGYVETLTLRAQPDGPVRHDEVVTGPVAFSHGRLVVTGQFAGDIDLAGERRRTSCDAKGCARAGFVSLHWLR